MKSLSIILRKGTKELIQAFRVTAVEVQDKRRSDKKRVEVYNNLVNYSLNTLLQSRYWEVPSLQIIALLSGSIIQSR